MNENQPQGSFQTFTRLFRYSLQYRLRLVMALACTALVSVLSVFSLGLLIPVVDILFFNASQKSDIFLVQWFYGLLEKLPSDQPLYTLGYVALCFLFITALTGVVRYLQVYLVNWIGNRVILDLQKELFTKMTRFNAGYFALQRVGALVSYYTVDIRLIGIALFSAMGTLLLDPCILFVAFTTLLVLNWKLTLIYAVIFPLIVLTVQFYARRNRKAGRKSQEIMARLGSFLQEHFSHIRLVQGYGMYSHQDQRFWKEARGVFDTAMSMTKARAASSPINEFLGIFAFCCVLMVAGYFILHSDLKQSEFVFFAACLAKVYQPLKRLEKSVQEVQHGIAAAERVFNVLDVQAEVQESPNAVAVQSFDRTVEFENVSFSYDGVHPVLREITLSAKKGERIALVGPSGAGKTTLVNLIPRFYDPASGSVRIDGADVKDLRLDSLRSLIAIVTQDVMIFADTVRNNLTCGEDGFSDEEIAAAAKAAYADEFIRALPNGFDTVIGEQGTGLSGGQRQRVALARAFLRNAPILILDEATSALDSESEQHIKESMEALLKGRTSFVIAHRLSTVLHAEKIVVMDQGAIVDIGKHNDLLERCPLYKKLYHLQFAVESINQPVEIK